MHVVIPLNLSNGLIMMHHLILDRVILRTKHLADSSSDPPVIPYAVVVVGNILYIYYII